jgi:hypothetical protein
LARGDPPGSLTALSRGELTAVELRRIDRVDRL